MEAMAAVAFLGLCGAIITGVIGLGPIGRALGDRLRGKAAVHAAEIQDQLDEVLGRLDEVQRQLAEVGERQDFTERMLASARERGLLEGPKV